MANLTYKEQIDLENIKKLRELLKELPVFCEMYFRALENTKSSRTRLSYAYDLGVFFRFLKASNPSLKAMEIRKFPLSLLDELNASDIEEYLSYLQFYEKDGQQRINHERGKARKFAALRAFYEYYYKNGLIETNPTALVDPPKLHSKNIIRLEPNEVAQLLDMAESGEKLTAAQLRNHKKTKNRDVALLTLLLGTGIRVSECVGLDLQDVNFETNAIKIIRKGGNEDIVFFGMEVAEALHIYLEKDRKQLKPEAGHENALFISLKNQRLTVRSVERLVKKYASLVTSLKKITPHKLRSTYGTSLYKETGDIYLVADVLGHKDVNTTRKHYAALTEDRKRAAANVVKLREP